MKSRDVIGFSAWSQVQKAYRDLVQVWHPDRFTNNERLQSKAQEQLKEINLAYEYLLAKAAAQTTPVEQSESDEPSPGTAPPEDQSQDFSVEPEEPGRGRNVLWNILFLFAGLVLDCVRDSLVGRSPQNKHSFDYTSGCRSHVCFLGIQCGRCGAAASNQHRRRQPGERSAAFHINESGTCFGRHPGIDGCDKQCGCA